MVLFSKSNCLSKSDAERSKTVGAFAGSLLKLIINLPALASPANLSRILRSIVRCSSSLGVPLLNEINLDGIMPL